MIKELILKVQKILQWVGVSTGLCAGALVALVLNAHEAEAGPKSARIYVIREADGVLRFTDSPPDRGQRAEVFTAKGSGGSFTRIRSSGKRKPSYSHDLYNEAINAAADEHQVDPALIKAVIHAESAFNPFAVSPKGAKGLMQLMPATARMLGLRNPYSPSSNIRAGTRYLAQLLKRFPNEAHAIAAYNAGEVPVTRYNGVPPYAETRAYVRRVLALKKQYTASLNG